MWHLIERHPKLSDIALNFVSCVSCVILPFVLAFFGPFIKRCVWTAGQEQSLLGKNKPSGILRGDVVTADPLKLKSAKRKKGGESMRTSANDSFASHDIRNKQKNEMKDEQNAENEEELLEEEVAAAAPRKIDREAGKWAAMLCPTTHKLSRRLHLQTRPPLFSSSTPRAPRGELNRYVSQSRGIEH